MVSQDYEEFLDALNRHGVRYLVVGAHAVALHARPRATKDLDILLDPAPENAARALEAIRVFFGGTDLGYSAEDLADPAWIVQLGVAPVRIDLFSSLKGFPEFQSAWKGRVRARFGNVDTDFLGLEDLIQAKEAAGRKQDLADLAVLRRALEEKSEPGRGGTGPA